MIAASHIAPTNPANEVSSSKTGVRHDAGSQSFSESLGVATQHAQAAAKAENSQKSSASSKRSSDSDKSSKVRTKRDTINDTIDSDRLQVADDADHTMHTMVLPTVLNVPADSGVNDSASPSSASDDSTSTVSATETQGSTWINFGGSPSWTAHQMQLNATGSDTAQQDAAAVPSADATNALDSQVQVATNDATPQQTKVSSTITPAPPAADSAMNALTASESSPTSNAAAAAATEQTAAVSNQNLPPVQFGAQRGGLNIAAVAPAKASTAFKSVQNLNLNGKNFNLDKNLAPGAKETDSYLSIQKDAKSGSDAAKDVSDTVQPGTHADATQQVSVSPIATPAQIHSTAVSNAHEQPVNFSLNDAASATAAQAKQEASLSSQLEKAVATATTSTSEVASTVVNTAKLMQSIGQSEMRVGMRTAEFGDISIRTSSTRDSISAQILLGHEDLAKTLTAHMPEMQTRLTTGEVVDVHIHSEGQAANYTGGQGNSDNGEAQNQQQDGGTSRSSFFNSYSSNQSATSAMPAAVMASSSNAIGRLDIRA